MSKESGLRQYGFRAPQKVIPATSATEARAESRNMSGSMYVVYSHETFMCEECYGYGRKSRLGPEELGGAECGVCHGLGSVGDSGTVVPILPGSESRHRRAELKTLRKNLGKEKYAALMATEQAERRRRMNRKRFPNG